MQATAPASAPAPRYTIRQLPLPAKLVVTLFMLTVGLGYFSALVQMHFQHTQGDGQPMPGVNDVIEIFAGKKWVTREEAAAMRPQSKLELMVMGSRETFSASSMAGAFFEHDGGAFQKAGRGGADAALVAAREGEQKLVQLWIMAPEADRKSAYENNMFKPKVDAPATATAEFLHGAAIADGVKIKSLLDARCARCHKPGGQEEDKPLDDYVDIKKYLEVPPGVEIPENALGAWCVSSRQISREKLAQSTHAHLLSFAMLFSLTGIVFAFTSHRAWIRFIIAPLVLIAQVADVSCWWLARIDGPGIYFAQAIMATGAFVGMGLGAQIVLSVFNMYGLKGKVVLAVLFVGAGLGLGLVGEKFAKPFLADQKAKKEKELADTEAAKKRPDGMPKPPPAVEPKVNGGIVKLERAFNGKRDPMNWVKNGVVPEGGMILAFFDKEPDFKAALKEMKDDPETFKKLLAERETEHAVVLAWIRTKAEDRKKVFEQDKFPLPADLKGKPFTADFFADDKAVKIKSMFEARCSSCHGAGTKVELDKYEDFEKFMK